MSSAREYLSRQRELVVGGSSEVWIKLDQFYTRRLWHQLTLEVLDLLLSSRLSNQQCVELYKEFVTDFEHRINTISLAEIGLIVTRPLIQAGETTEAIAIFNRIQEKVGKQSPEALILCLVGKGNAFLMAREKAKVKEIIEEASGLIDNLDGVTGVHDRFYSLSSDFAKLTEDHAEYYRESLKLLGCLTAPEKLPDLEQRLFMICVAGILGTGIYNFGELLSLSVLERLRKSSANGWIVELVEAFNFGDIDKFEMSAGKWKQLEDLKRNEMVLQEKIRLLCLVQMAFSLAVKKRQLSFTDIARVAKLSSENEIEMLLMRAMSLGLIKGKIDEVSRVVSISWIQPRVLNLEQVGNMADRLKTWLEEVKSVENILEHKAEDILAAA